MKTSLWPHKFRKISYWLIAAGVLLSYAHLKGYRPAFLDFETFAIASTFLQKRFFVLIENNFLDELAFLTFQMGLLLQILTEEKVSNIKHDQYRLSSFIFSLKYTFLCLLLSYLLVFGYLSILLISSAFSLFCILYIVRFQYLLKRSVD